MDESSEKTKMLKSVSFSGLPSSNKKKEIDVDIWRSKIDMPVFNHATGRKGVFTLKKGPIIAAVVIMIVILLIFSQSHSWNYATGYKGPGYPHSHHIISYNRTYPLTAPWNSPTGGHCFKLGFITDMDTNSKTSLKGKDAWMSYFRTATVDIDFTSNKVSVKLIETDDDAIELHSNIAEGGRGMELSDLIVFNGNVYSVDDRTGIVYQIINKKAVAWVILPDGNGKQAKGFKGEWMAIRDDQLYVGGLGKEWTNEHGVILQNNPQWVKIIDFHGSIEHQDWGFAYTAMREKAGYTHPGYIIHESAVWSNVHNAWFFLPRRASTDPYDENTDEERGTNILFKCSSDFSKVEITTIGKLDHPTRGFSSFKFVPGSKDNIIIALKSEEYKGTTRSYITAFTVAGEILMPDMVMSQKYKYEGLEFL